MINQKSSGVSDESLNGSVERPLSPRYIDLPHAGGQRLDVARFVAYCFRFGTTAMAIGARKQTYDKFPREELNMLDPVLRRVFLPADSPYRNTMQAVQSVVDALVATGVFERTEMSFDCYDRLVNSIRINEDKAREFMAEHGNPTFVFHDGDKVLP